MRWAKFRANWDGAVGENAFLRKLVPLLLLTVILAMAGWHTKDRTIELVPPTISEKIEISRHRASEGYYKGLALFLAEMLGNVTPANADLVMESVQQLLAADVYNRVREQLAADIDSVKREKITVSFSPKQLIYESARQRVFVVGSSRVDGPGGKPTATERVFEFEMRRRDGQTLVTYVESYPGEPHTLEWQQRQPAQKKEGAK